VRVLQNGQVVARLSAIRKNDDRVTAIWQGAPPSFQPFEQVEPLVLESDDGLERRDGWLLSVLHPARGEGPLRVEFGPERSAPAWRRSLPPVERAGSSTTTRTKATGKPDVLVVDDDPETVAIVGDVLEEQGFLVRRATSGREALARAEERAPDVAILDLIMPEVSGEDVCAAMRRDPRYAHTRVLVLSGAEDTRAVAASCDADSAVTKPFTMELLVHEVRRLIGQ
jgi:two-component system phosphate regulon response regulator PhoB